MKSEKRFEAINNLRDLRRPFYLASKSCFFSEGVEKSSPDSPLI